jgi:hypothetical protein
MKSFFERLTAHTQDTQIPLTSTMAEVLVKIVVEIFAILSVATKELKRTCASEPLLHDILRAWPTLLFGQKYISGNCWEGQTLKPR